MSVRIGCDAVVFGCYWFPFTDVDTAAHTVSF